MAEKICILCLANISNDNFEILEETRKEMLEVLLVKIDLPENKQTIICNSCVEVLHMAFDFKTVCLYTEDFLTPFMNKHTKLDLRDMYLLKVENKSIKIETQAVCRFCMELKDNSSLNDTNKVEKNILLRAMVEDCLPEMDLSSTEDPIICDPCLNSLTNKSNFKKKCLDAKEILKENEVSSKVYIKKEKSVKIEDSNIIRKTNKKKGCEFQGESFNKTLKLVSTSEFNIEEEEDFDIKMEEVDATAESESSAESATKKPKIYTDGSRKTNTTDRPAKNRSGKYSCKKCTVVSNFKTIIAAHELTHENPPIYMCDLCGYKSKKKKTLLDHEKEHAGPSRRFGCKQCDFESDHKTSYRTHLMIQHGELEELKLLNCAFCEYVTKYWSALQNHERIQHGDAPIYHCELCEFKSKHKISMKMHAIQHKSKSERKLFRCDQCEFTANFSGNLKQHQKVHLKPGEYIPAKCPHCPYEAKRETSLKKHLMRHLDRDQVKMYKCTYCLYESNNRPNLQRHLRSQHIGGEKVLKCNQCSFTAKQKISLTIHMLKHKDKAAKETFKCDLCPFKTSVNTYLLRHQRKHKTFTDAEMFRCAECDYKGRNKGGLRRHVLTHKTLSEVETFSCHQCNFRTKYKISLRSHLFIHNPDMPGIRKYQCTQCDYSTRERGNLTAHMITHKEPGETPIYKCKDCHFKTKYRFNLKAHETTCKRKKGRKTKKQTDISVYFKPDRRNIADS